MRKGIYIVCLVASFMILPSPEAKAKEGRILFGKTSIIPGITIQEIYNDNIYLGSGANNTTELEEDDWITHIKPGLSLKHDFAGRRGGLNIGYVGDFACYWENDDNNWSSHEGFADLKYTAPGGLILEFNNTYKATEDPYGSDNQYKLGVPKTERWSNTLKTKAGYKFSDRFKAFAFYNYYKQDYDLKQDFTQDYNTNEAGAGLQVRVLPKTWGFVRYHYGKRDYCSHPAGWGVTEANDADFDWHRANVGVTWDTGTKLSGELNLGYIWKGYDNTTDSTGNIYEDKDTWIASTGISFTAAPTTTLSLSMTRKLRDSGADSRQYYEDTGIGLGLTQVFLGKITLSLNGACGRNNYNSPVGKEKKQDNYLASAKLDYEIQDWLSAGAGYSYFRKDSNYIVDEFTNNQFTITLRMVY